MYVDKLYSFQEDFFKNAFNSLFGIWIENYMKHEKLPKKKFEVKRGLWRSKLAGFDELKMFFLECA